MPITPLHFGLLAPINYFAPNKVSNVSFILVTFWIDAQAIASWFLGLPLPNHTWETHSLIGGLGIGLVVAIFGIRSKKWILGALMSAVTHIAVDALVHLDMSPLHPLLGNPFYMGWMEPLSWALLPLLVWLTAQYVSGSMGWLRKHRTEVPVVPHESVR